MAAVTIWDDILVERERQRRLWSGAHAFGIGDCSSDAVPASVKVAVLLEEVGEVARALLEQDEAHMRTELVQVAAVAVAMIEWLDCQQVD